MKLGIELEDHPVASTGRRRTAHVAVRRGGSSRLPVMAMMGREKERERTNVGGRAGGGGGRAATRMASVQPGPSTTKGAATEQTAEGWATGIDWGESGMEGATRSVVGTERGEHPIELLCWTCRSRPLTSPSQP